MSLPGRKDPQSVLFPALQGAAPAVVGALRLDAAALGALVDHLTGLQLQALQVLFCGISFGHCPLQQRDVF